MSKSNLNSMKFRTLWLVRQATKFCSGIMGRCLEDSSTRRLLEQIEGRWNRSSSACRRILVMPHWHRKLQMAWMESQPGPPVSEFFSLPFQWFSHFLRRPLLPICPHLFRRFHNRRIALAGTGSRTGGTGGRRRRAGRATVARLGCPKGPGLVVAFPP